MPSRHKWEVQAQLYTQSTPRWKGGGGGGQHHAPAALPLGEEARYPWYRRLGGPLGRSRWIRKTLASNGVQTPDRPARSIVAMPTTLSRPPAILCEICIHFWVK
jgi:hypothetical protein